MLESQECECSKDNMEAKLCSVWMTSSHPFNPLSYSQRTNNLKIPKIFNLNIKPTSNIDKLNHLEEKYLRRSDAYTLCSTISVNNVMPDTTTVFSLIKIYLGGLKNKIIKNISVAFSIFLQRNNVVYHTNSCPVLATVIKF